MDFDFAEFLAQKKEFNHSQISYFIYQILSAVRYLKSIGIYHRDIKPSNIGVMRLSNNLKFLDFGASLLGPDDDTNHVVKDTTRLQKYYRLDQYNKITEKLGSPSQDFIEKISKPIIKTYVENQPEYKNWGFERLFSDLRFPGTTLQYPTLIAWNGLWIFIGKMFGD
ncbi:Mitogen-activated protein kinase 8 [Orchesella cincta]|uniref:Mitogen-activated protein kinase 8 n=1 Tax=Orchesella cincta TaxID=48709 RepID=A0A1D2M4F0_ORCCI|nr:Mitogen-activated protein kinase 8 [Orchesella cincta]